MSGNIPNLRIRLALIFGLLSLLLSALLSVAVGGDAAGRIRDAVGDSLGHAATHLLDRLDQDLLHRYAELQLAAADAIDAQDDPDALRQRLERLQSVFPLYVWIGHADADGVITAASDRFLEGKNVADQAWFSQGRDGPFFGGPGASLQLERLRPPGGGPERFVTLAVPVLDSDGQVRGVLAAHISWHWARELARAIAGEATQPGLELLLLDEQGIVQLGPEPLEGMPVPFPRARQHDGGYVVETWPNGRHYISSLAPPRAQQRPPRPRWQVLARQDADLALAEVSQLQDRILLWGGFLGALFAAAGWWSAARIAAPLRALTEAAERTRRGGSPAELPQLDHYQEVAALSATLNDLVTELNADKAQLGALSEALREKLQTHALELHNANSRLQQETAERNRLQEERERLIARMQELADIDPVTEVANRRYFDRLAEAELERARTRGQSLAVIAFDVDNLAQLNEEQGLAAGDEILRVVAHCARLALRQLDTLARLEGEGFVALLPEADLATAMTVAERLRVAIAEQRFSSRRGELRVTASFGVADLQPHNRHINELLQRADAALYQAKQGGRNQVRQA